MFKKNSYVKIIDTSGNFRFGYIVESKDSCSLLLIDLSDEGLSKINWDEEYSNNVPGGGTENFLNVKKKLTDTEERIILLLAELSTKKQIAEKLNISPITVRAHIRYLKNKLQVDTWEQLVTYSQGIICKKS